mgnify:FL=1
MGFFDLLRSRFQSFVEDDISPEQIMKQAVFLNWAKSLKEISYDSDYYPKYFYYTYDITNCPKYHKELISAGFLGKPAPAELLQSYKATDLKAILDTLNLPKNGKKADMIARILEYADEDQLWDLCKETNGYVLTGKGLNYIKKYEEYIELHKCTFEISLEEYEDMKQKLGTEKPWHYSDIIWGILTEREIKYRRRKDPGLLRNNFYYKYKHLKKSHPKEAYQMLMVVHLIDFEDNFNPPGILDALIKDSEYFSEDMILRCYKHFHGGSNPQDFGDVLKKEIGK